MNGSISLSFGAWLKERRRVAGISRDELAERAACSSITLQKIEAGERRPSRQLALILAQVFDVPEDEREAFVAFARTYGRKDETIAHSMGVNHDLPASTPSSDDVQAQSPWRAAHTKRGNLPTPLTSFIGRTQEVAGIRGLLAKPAVRLVTLMGAPGIGKTRLSLQVAAHREVVENFTDGVWFVELAAVTDPLGVLPVVAHTLGLQEEAGSSTEQLLLAHVAHKRLLLLLDNFEQVLDAGPQVVKLIGGSPWLKVVVTSREALHVQGERRFSVPPLAFPQVAAGDKPDTITLSRSPAVQLFVERSQDVQPDFELTDENAQDVVAICAGLDGLPLAIELAASRANILSPGTVREALSNRLRLLTKGARDLPPRHRTLRAAIDWSYNLLNESEQTRFRRLAVFTGGFTADAAEATYSGGANGAEGEQTETSYAGEELLELVDKGLLYARKGGGGEPRFWMLETISEYAKQKLEESAEAERFFGRHAAYFLEFAEKADAALRGPEQGTWYKRFWDEGDNIRAALRWSATRGDKETVLRIASALWLFWEFHGLVTEGRHWLDVALQGSGQVPGQVRAKALKVAGNLAIEQRDFEQSWSLQEQALVLYGEIGDQEGVSGVLNNMGLTASFQSDFVRAGELFEQSLHIARELGYKRGVSITLQNLAYVYRMRGDYTQARSLLQASLALRREFGDREALIGSLTNLADLAVAQDEYAEAEQTFEECLIILSNLGDKKSIAGTLIHMGQLAQYKGDHERARTLTEEGLCLIEEMYRDQKDEWRINQAQMFLADRLMGQGDYSTAQPLLIRTLGAARSLDVRPAMARVVMRLGEIAESRGEYVIARASFEESLTLFQEGHQQAGVGEAIACLAHLARRQGEYEQATRLYEEARGMFRVMGARRFTALSLAGLAGVAVDTQQPLRAARLFGAAEELLDTIGAELDVPRQNEMEQDKANTCTQLDKAMWERAYGEGRSRTFQQALEYALESDVERTVTVATNEP